MHRLVTYRYRLTIANNNEMKTKDVRNSRMNFHRKVKINSPKISSAGDWRRLAALVAEQIWVTGRKDQRRWRRRTEPQGDDIIIVAGGWTDLAGCMAFCTATTGSAEGERTTAMVVFWKGSTAGEGWSSLF
ncbi:hypothetical protein FXO37_06071 [Capsicum annuum]|nr:hypothetical protein FXO37_06071 [Capsicum annuum]